MSQQQKCKVWECQARSVAEGPYCLNCYNSKYGSDVKCPNCRVELGYYSTHTCEVKEKKVHPLGFALKQNEDYCGACLEVYSSNFNHVCKPLTVCDKTNDSFFVEDNKSIKQKLKDCILSQIESMTGQVGKLDLEIGVYKKVLNQLELL